MRRRTRVSTGFEIKRSNGCSINLNNKLCKLNNNVERETAKWALVWRAELDFGKQNRTTKNGLQ